MKKRSIFLVFFAAALFLPPVLFPASAKAQGAFVIAPPKIDRIDLDPPSRLIPGETLIFRITGTPRAKASVDISSMKRKITLREVMAGIYEGAYTIKPGDRIGPYSAVTGNLRLGKQESTAMLGQPLVENSTYAAAQ